MMSSGAKTLNAVMQQCLDLVASYQNRSGVNETDAADLLHARFLYKQRIESIAR